VGPDALVSAAGGSHDLDRPLLPGEIQADVQELRTQRAGERPTETFSERLSRLAEPDARQRRHGDQIADRAAELLEL
jgi:hypothetical protein